jgi:hypothetical protein
MADRIIYKYGEGFNKEGQCNLEDLGLKFRSKEYLLSYLKFSVELNMIVNPGDVSEILSRASYKKNLVIQGSKPLLLGSKVPTSQPALTNNFLSPDQEEFTAEQLKKYQRFAKKLKSAVETKMLKVSFFNYF